MKRALLPLAAAALVLGACGNDTEAPSSEAETDSESASASQTASPGGETATPPPSGVVSANAEVRAVCQAGVLERAAAASFPTPGLLRVGSTAEGKQYLVSGTAEVDGTPTSYTCQVLATTESIELTEVTLGNEVPDS